MRTSREDITKLEIKIDSLINKFEENKYQFIGMLRADISEAFNHIYREEDKTKECSTCVCWTPYLREGTCSLKIKCVGRQHFENQITLEDFNCKHHAFTFNIEEEK